MSVPLWVVAIVLLIWALVMWSLFWMIVVDPLLDRLQEYLERRWGLRD